MTTPRNPASFDLSAGFLHLICLSSAGRSSSHYQTRGGRGDPRVRRRTSRRGRIACSCCPDGGGYPRRRDREENIRVSSPNVRSCRVSRQGTRAGRWELRGSRKITLSPWCSGQRVGARGRTANAEVILQPFLSVDEVVIGATTVTRKVPIWGHRRRDPRERRVGDLQRRLLPSVCLTVSFAASFPSPWPVFFEGWSPSEG